METKHIVLTVIEFLAFAQLPLDVRIVQKGTTLYTGSITRIPAIILNEKIIHIGITPYSDILKIEIE